MKKGEIMSKSMYKTQIVLEPEQHKALTEIAEREGRSIAELVQDLVKQALEQHERRRTQPTELFGRAEHDTRA